MFMNPTRREFLAKSAALAAAGAWSLPRLLADDDNPPVKARVIIARDEALTRGEVDEHRDLLRKLLDAAMQKLTGAADAGAAYRKLFKPSERIGIKVNTLGFTVRPAVVDALVAGLRAADIPAENIIIWDRFDKELVKAGFTLNKTGQGVQCRGTDAERIGSGYQEKVETSGQIGSCYSKILAEDIDALICVPVLKDHSIAGVTLTMKSFYGAIHNPNKYHDQHCDPYIVDVVSHPLVRNKLRLSVCDAVRAQCQGGPGVKREYVWPYGGLLAATDYVALDAVGADIIEAQRRERGLKPVAEDGRPFRYIATAAERGLGIADLNRIERVAV